MTHFFDLPRELRDLIYVNYVSVKGGYILDFNRNILKGADNQPIDLALMFSCKAIAEEMKGLALSSNTLNFATFHSEELNLAAGRFESMLEFSQSARGGLMLLAPFHKFGVPHDVWETLETAHPTFAPYLDLLKPGRSQRNRYRLGSPGSCGETPSTFRNFIRSALETFVSQKDRFDKEQFAKFEADRCQKLSLQSLVEFNPDPWDIPTPQTVEEMVPSLGKYIARSMRIKWGCEWQEAGRREDQIKYHYSAAAVAIRFLRSLPTGSRASIRNIVLHENRLSVAYAECHGLGLIWYCQENPRLRVHRRVSLWRTVFQTTTANSKFGVMPPHVGHNLPANEISCPLAVWVLEALELESAGMPRGSFTLTLEGDETCSEIFQTVVQRDAAWQAAFDVCVKRKYLPPLPWYKRRQDGRNCYAGDGEAYEKTNHWYLFEAFPQAIWDIVAGTSIVKCDFWVGKAWDVERVVEENKDLNLMEWKEAWFVRDRLEFSPDPPTPSWPYLLAENSLETVLPFPEDYEWSFGPVRPDSDIDSD